MPDDLHGSAPDDAAVALLLIDVINDLAFDGGEALLAQALPVRRWTASSSGMTWARSLPFVGVVRFARGMPAASVRLWMRMPLPLRP
jgi:hypothetical protein